MEVEAVRPRILGQSTHATLCNCRLHAASSSDAPSNNPWRQAILGNGRSYLIQAASTLRIPIIDTSVVLMVRPANFHPILLTYSLRSESCLMNLDDYLSKATIVDCNGQTAYEMTLLLNGDVLVCGRVGNYQINPTTRETTPVGKVVPVEIVEQAVAFARSCL